MKRHAIACSVWLMAQVGAAHAQDDFTRHAAHGGARSALFTISNEAGGNRVLAFAAAADGGLSLADSVATGGSGSGDSLGSQGALALSDDGAFLIAVNAGSNELSSFAVSGAQLRLRDRVDSGGVRPISVTIRRGLVFALNAGTPNTIAGFTLDRRGMLTPLRDASLQLSATDTGPAEIAFNPEGTLLLVTEKAANKLIVFRVGAFGHLFAPRAIDSAGMTPYGFAFDDRGHAIVSEASTNSLSSYDLARRSPLLSAAVPDTQSAPCWVAISSDGRFAFTANAASASISSYEIEPSGTIELNAARAAELGDAGHPLDLAFGQGGRYLYALDRGHAAISGFALERDGSLTPLAASVMDLPEFATGLAAQ